MNADSPDLSALIAKAREPYLWAYPTVQGLVAALEAWKFRHNLLAEQHLEMQKRAQTAEAERERIKAALLAHIRESNSCSVPCADADKCGCVLEMKEACEAIDPP